MSRYAVFVDAGYVFGQGTLSLSSGKIPRSKLRLNQAEIVNQLKSVTARPSSELLRIYWYDGTRGNMSAEQQILAEMPDVKVRLGYTGQESRRASIRSSSLT